MPELRILGTSLELDSITELIPGMIFRTIRVWIWLTLVSNSWVMYLTRVVTSLNLRENKESFLRLAANLS